MANALISMIGGILLLPTLLPMLWVDWWWVRIWDFPRLQLVLLYLVVIALLSIFARKRWAGLIASSALALCVVYQFFWIFPYLPIAPLQTLDATTRDENRFISILVANVLMTNRASDQFLRIVKDADPDVLIIDEPDHWWEEQLRVLDPSFPYSTKHPLENTYGMIFYSKLPVLTSEVRFLVEKDIPSIHAVITLRSGEDVQLIAVHPRPPLPSQDTEERDAELILVGRQTKASGLPSIVAGDMNDVGWSQTTELFQRVSGLLDPRRGRGFYATYNAHYPGLRYPLDHLFHSPEFRLRKMAVLDYLGSDHFPFLVELSYEPERSQEHEVPSVSLEDKARAEEQLRQVDRTR